MKRTKRILSAAIILLLLVQLLGGTALAGSEFEEYHFFYECTHVETDYGFDVTASIRDIDGEDDIFIDDLIEMYQPFIYILKDGEEYDYIFVEAPQNGESEATVEFSLTEEGMYEVCLLDMEGMMGVNYDENGYFVPFYYGYEISYGYEEVFKDVPEDQWYYDYVYMAYASGLIKGVAEDRFDPEGYMTYAQAITLAARMHKFYYGGDPMDFEATVPWYDVYIDYARENGIPCDYDNYDAPITREEYVHIFYSALPESEFKAANDVSDGAIPDIGMDHKYADEIYAFYRAGILNGSDAKGTFNPTWNIKRSEVSAILCRMFGIGRV